MADRYWVGGTGTWNNSNTANWSTSSGGSGGASVPTNLDFVYFDSNSGTGNCTYSDFSGIYYGRLNFTGYSGTFTNSATLRIDGSLFFSPGMTLSGFSDIYVWPGALGGVKTADYWSYGKSPYSIEFLAQSGSSVVLRDNVSVQTNLYFSLRNGFIYADNRTITTGSRVTLSTNTGSTNNYLYFSGSTINTERFEMEGFGTGTANIVTNSSTVVNLTGSYPVCYLGGQYTNAFTMPTVNVSGSVSSAYYRQYNTSLHRVGTLWINASTSNHFFESNFYTSNFQVTGAAKTVRSNSAGTAITITAATSYLLENVSFRDITAAGSIPFSGTGLVDLGGNTNITFLIPGSSLFFGSNF